MQGNTSECIYLIAFLEKKTSSIKSNKTVPSIGRWWRCWRGIFCSVFLLAGQFFPETTLQKEINRRTLLLVSFSLYATYKNPPKEANQKDKGSFTKSDHGIGSQTVGMRILLCSTAHLTKISNNDLYSGGRRFKSHPP